MDYIGIDLHKNSSQVCILTDRESFDKLSGERLPAHTLAQIEPLLLMLGVPNEQIELADKRPEQIVKTDEVVKRLCSVPGVGPVVATTFAAALDDASRFLGAKHVRSYLGLVPREYSSGERQRRGRISKAGSGRARQTAWPIECRRRNSAARPRIQTCAGR